MLNFADVKNKVLLILCAVVSLFCSCAKEDIDSYDTGKEFSRVTVGFYLANNNLSSYIRENIDSLELNALPKKTDGRAVLAYIHQKYSNPVLVRIYSDWRGNAVRDTLIQYPKECVSANADTIRNVMNYILENYKSDHYGLLFSSHGSGWLPQEYSISRRNFGNEADSRKDVHEIEIKDLFNAIRMENRRYDYIIFDACFMGCVEVAYQAKDICREMVFSSTEVLSYGMNYSSMTKYLLKDEPYSLKNFCEAYYQQYSREEQQYLRSCTISLVNLENISELGSVCCELINKYRNEIYSLNSNRVQRYFRNLYDYLRYAYLYDLKDILVNAGISSEELSRLDEALNNCVEYKASTESFMIDENNPTAYGGFSIENFCGMSMYLPSIGNDDLDKYYKSLNWNNVTGLVI